MLEPGYGPRVNEWYGSLYSRSLSHQPYTGAPVQVAAFGAATERTGAYSDDDPGLPFPEPRARGLS